MYKTPPITEAVLEFQLSTAVPMAALERAKGQLVQRLPTVVDEQVYQVQLDTDNGTVSVNGDHSGFRLHGSVTNSEIVILKRKSFSVSNLAPYRGWDEFIELAMQGWAAFTAAAEPRDDIARVGLRYINRIDVPVPPIGSFNVKDYLTFVYEAPQPPLGPSMEFLVTMVSKVGDLDECGVRITSSLVESPVPEHSGVILDIDVFSSGPVALDSEQLWGMVERMRVHKNAVFELCITDRARELFSRG